MAENTITIHPDFVCVYEVQNKSQFQADGHFVCGLKDEHGFRREWEGDEVHILTFKHQGQQVLRMMADSLEEVSRLMGAELEQTLIGLWTAQFLQGQSTDQFVRLRDRLADLETFISEQYKAEIGRGQHGGFPDIIATSMYYMGKEREMNSKAPAKLKAVKR